MKLKLGLDIHGVCDENLEFFATLTRLLVDNGHEVHLLTGPQSFKSFPEAKKLGLSWTHLFSITDYHLEKGTPMTLDAGANPFMDEYLWDRTKADYCREHGIHLHLDDSDAYGYFFKTPYARYYSKNKRKHYTKSAEPASVNGLSDKRCEDCHGTGRSESPGLDSGVAECGSCDGSGTQ